MKPLEVWTHHSVHDDGIDLAFEGGCTLRLLVLERDIIRVLLVRREGLRLDRTWSIEPNDCRTPWEGRRRISVEGFSRPAFDIKAGDGQIILSTDRLRTTIAQPLHMSWEYKNEKGTWVPLAADRSTGALELSRHTRAIAHYMNLEPDESFYGLGDKTGALNLAQRRFEMRGLDAMGFDPERTDPLYKHIPFYISRQPARASYGVFYDNLATSWFNFGVERDNYHKRFRSYRAEDGDLDYYLILGPRIADVVKKYTSMTGRSAFMPKWSLGFGGSSMGYADAPDAQSHLEEFLNRLSKECLPCNLFHLSSGYTSIGSQRFVFHWNRDKFPDPSALKEFFHRAGVKLIANVKPCMLTNHPQYEGAAQASLFIKDSETDKPHHSPFWDGKGAHLDFTNPKTIDLWKANITSTLLKVGITSIWNDNNEFEVWDHEARCYGFGAPAPIGLMRQVQTTLMVRASEEAQLEHTPNERPFVLSRSAGPGTHRHAQSWSGDNRTSWASLKYNIRTGLNMALSGLSNIGHDVGGFAGPKPGPELLLRWIQNGIMHPRFTIHSWNEDGSATEPFMYPEITPFVRQAFELRYHLLPYFYNLLWRLHRYHEPMIRPTFYDWETDKACFDPCHDFMAGGDLLVASVVEEGARERSVYLPNNDGGWYDFSTGRHHDGGQTIVLSAPLDRLPLLARAGAIIPTREPLKNSSITQDDVRTLRLFPRPEFGKNTAQIFDDDGTSWAYQDGGYCLLDCSITSTMDEIRLDWTRTGTYAPAYKEIRVLLPADEKRQLVVNGAVLTSGDCTPL